MEMPPLLAQQQSLVLMPSHQLMVLVSIRARGRKPLRTAQPYQSRNIELRMSKLLIVRNEAHVLAQETSLAQGAVQGWACVFHWPKAVTSMPQGTSVPAEEALGRCKHLC